MLPCPHPRRLPTKTKTKTKRRLVLSAGGLMTSPRALCTRCLKKQARPGGLYCVKCAQHLVLNEGMAKPMWMCTYDKHCVRSKQPNTESVTVCNAHCKEMNTIQMTSYRYYQKKYGAEHV
jgi:hypothetical protein